MSDRLESIELRLLRAFTVLAEELNFGRASTRLHVTQPALSAQLRQMEQRLGFPLFDRSTRRVSLTPEGATLLGPARSLLAEGRRFGEVVAQVRGKPQRRLVFGAALYTLGIPERQALLEAFFERHPDVLFSVTVAWQREMVDGLLRGEADFALMLGAPVPLSRWEAEPTAEVLFPETLPRMVLREEPVTLLAPRESPLAALERIPASALKGANVAMLGSQHGALLLGAVRAALAEARVIVPPEPHGIGVERYGRQFRMPAVCLGWFNTGGDDDPDMVRLPVEGLEIWTQLSLVRSAGNPTAASDLFWREARARFPEAPVHNCAA